MTAEPPHMSLEEDERFLALEKADCADCGHSFKPEHLDDRRLCETCDLVREQALARVWADVEDAVLYRRGMKAWEKLREQVSRDLAQLDHPEYPALAAAMDNDGKADALRAGHLAALPFGDEEDRKVAFKEAEDHSLAATAAKARAAQERYGELIRAHTELVYGVDRASLKHTLPMVAGDTEDNPALLQRSDGQTLLYEGKLNTIVGEPSTGKSWIALMAVIQALRSGARVVWWDFEDSPSTLSARLTALGAGELIESENLVYVTPDLAEDADEMARTALWMRRDWRAGLVVIDSVESAGLPTDSNNVRPWYSQHVDPFLSMGAGVLLLDHVPKRREDRPRGPIGSQHKRARVNGAVLFVDGTAWTKREGGKVTIRNHKDRLGDLPAPVPKVVAIVEVTHAEDGKLEYTIRPPEDADDTTLDVTLPLLEAIASYGPQGVRTHKAVRELLKAGGKVIDLALEDLMKMGFVVKAKDGRASIFVVTADGERFLTETPPQ